MNRRGFLKSILAAGAAPYVVTTAELLMPVRPLATPDVLTIEKLRAAIDAMKAETEKAYRNLTIYGTVVWADGKVLDPKDYVAENGSIVLAKPAEIVRIEQQFIYQGRLGIQGSRMSGPFAPGDRIFS